MESVISSIKENNLKLTLAFGIGLHHAGLHERDRKAVEELFVNQKIQVSTADLFHLLIFCHLSCLLLIKTASKQRLMEQSDVTLSAGG